MSPFETNHIGPKQTIEVSVEMFAEIFGQRDTAKLLHKHSRETMEISANLLLKMLQAPPKSTQKEIPWGIFSLVCGTIIGVLLALILRNTTGLGWHVFLTLGGVFIGSFSTFYWKKIEKNFATQQMNYWEERLEHLQ